MQQLLPFRLIPLSLVLCVLKGLAGPILSPGGFDFIADDSTVCVGEVVNFSLLEGPAATVTWDFGEGAEPATAMGPGPHHVRYTSAGSKTVQATSNESGSVIKEDFITVNPVPLDKIAVPEFHGVCEDFATNIIVLNYEPDIMYLLRRDSDSSDVAGPWPGYIGLYSFNLTETTTFHVLATNPVTGCQSILEERPTVIRLEPPEDRAVFAENPSGPPGHATNVIVSNGQPDVLYLLRNDSTDEAVAGPYPAGIGLYTGPVSETTTFNVFAYYDGANGCDTEMLTKVTITIEDTVSFDDDSVTTEVPEDSVATGDPAEDSVGTQDPVVIEDSVGTEDPVTIDDSVATGDPVVIDDSVDTSDPVVDDDTVAVDDGLAGEVDDGDASPPDSVDTSEAIPWNSLNIYPHPNNGVFKLVMRNKFSGKYQYTVHHFSGSIVTSDTFDKDDDFFDVGFNLRLSAGVYVLTIRYLESGNQKGGFVRRRLLITD